MTIQHYGDNKGWQDFSRLIKSQSLAVERDVLSSEEKALSIPRATKGVSGKVRVCEHVTIDFLRLAQFAEAKDIVQGLCDQRAKCTFGYLPRLVRTTNHIVNLQENMKMSREEKAKVPEHYWKDCGPHGLSARSPLTTLICFFHTIPCVAPGIVHPEQSLLEMLHDNKAPICEHLRMGNIVQKGKRGFGAKKIDLHI